MKGIAHPNPKIKYKNYFKIYQNPHLSLPALRAAWNTLFLNNEDAARPARYLAEKLRAFGLQYLPFSQRPLIFLYFGALFFYDHDPTVQNERGFFCLFSQVLELHILRSSLSVPRSSSLVRSSVPFHLQFFANLLFPVHSLFYIQNYQFCLYIYIFYSDHTVFAWKLFLLDAFEGFSSINCSNFLRICQFKFQV